MLAPFLCTLFNRSHISLVLYENVTSSEEKPCDSREKIVRVWYMKLRFHMKISNFMWMCRGSIFFTKSLSFIQKPRVLYRQFDFFLLLLNIHMKVAFSTNIIVISMERNECWMSLILSIEYQTGHTSTQMTPHYFNTAAKWENSRPSFSVQLKNEDTFTLNAKHLNNIYWNSANVRQKGKTTTFVHIQHLYKVLQNTLVLALDDFIVGLCPTHLLKICATKARTATHQIKLGVYLDTNSFILHCCSDCCFAFGVVIHTTLNANIVLHIWII